MELQSGWSSRQHQGGSSSEEWLLHEQLQLVSCDFLSQLVGPFLQVRPLVLHLPDAPPQRPVPPALPVVGEPVVARVNS